MTEACFEKITAILKQEMMTAMGCTEPAAIAFAGAKAAALLQEAALEAEIWVSRDLIKNVQSVEIPRAEGKRGIETALAIGLAHGSAERGLCILEEVEPPTVSKALEMMEASRIHVHEDSGVEGLHLVVRARSAHHTAEVEIAGTHTNIVYEARDGRGERTEEERETQGGSDMSVLSMDSILAYVERPIPEEIQALCRSQLEKNMAIAREGMAGGHGLGVGKTLLSEGGDVWMDIRAYAAAGSDARMAGCTMPVVISAGSGNQGITIAVPLARYAERENVEPEKVIRAAVLANLISLYIKSGIGWLSSFCGAVSASCACACGLACMRGMDRAGIERVIINTLCNASGMVCDGAKASCAAKIATSLDAAFLALRLAESGRCCPKGTGIVTGSAEDVIRAIWKIGSIGMNTTDDVIVDLMLNRSQVPS